ncbi:putative general transcription factor II-I repeat domain-containing protein 2-like [Triplophysa rosa]|uniref:General transcription factor II-I repeat domain-containing protein 2-like n=1 Tax=Triplophysa rosa TaxID=992332 RepID=A0A9W7T2R2_TRIRA|nr:putative general transcription factor II-I repeat domain-containing protein 2-like [Triplophysa rosa]
MRGITAEFETTEELLSLQAMHGTTKGEDLFKQVVLALNKFELPFEKLSGLAPAMLGPQKGLTALIKKEMSHLCLDPSDLVVCHCIIHQESLRGLNSRQFKELLSDLESEYGDLVYHCEVRWLSRADMLARFYNLREEVKQFMEIKGKTVVELSDAKWLCDLWPLCECAKLHQAFGERFQDMKSKQKELKIFATPFNVEPSDVPDNLQHEIIELQSNDECKAKYNNLPLLEFYKLYVRSEDFPILRICTELRVASSSLPSDIRRLTKEKQFQPSH